MEKDLVSLVKDAGIVGAGGAGFPTHVKLNAKAEYIIVNGAECEPLLRVDQQLMDKEAKKLLEGVKLIMENTGATKGVIGLKDKYKDAIASIESLLINYNNISIHKMGNFYPAGDEQVLVYEVTKRIVPEGGIPLNVGVIVSNVETIINVHDAYFENKPVTHKYVTVTGAVNNKKTVKVPIGISVKETIELADGSYLEEYVVINGGPMMGKLISINDKITKTTKGLIVLPTNHSLVNTLRKDINKMLKESKTACMHCSHCTEVCPRNMIGHSIHPDKMMRLASYSSVCSKEVTPVNSFLCCECRLCEYACIMGLQPWKLHGSLKQNLAKQGIRNTLNNKPENAHPFREYKKYPVKKLINKLELSEFDKDAPLEISEYKFDKVSILLSQHIGAKSIPTVKVNDEVKAGDLIAKIDENKLGANIHSSIDGVVSEISEEMIIISSN